MVKIFSSKRGHLMHIVTRISRREKNKKFDIYGVPNTVLSFSIKAPKLSFVERLCCFSCKKISFFSVKIIF